MLIFGMPEQTTFDDLEIDNLPNRITIFRVLLIPIVLFLLILGDSGIEAVTPYHPPSSSNPPFLGDCFWACSSLC